MTVLLGNGGGGFQSETTYNTTSYTGVPVVVAELGLDGELDLAIGTGPPGGVDVFWGNGDGTFQSAQFFNSGLTGLPAVGDFNNDHLLDLVLANELSVVSVLNTGAANFSPTAPLAFGVRLINTTTPPQTVTLTNNGTTALSIGSIKVSGQFKMSQTCGSSLAAGANCTISAVFEPTTAGPHKGLIKLVDSASSKPQYIELSGQATVVKVSATALDFGNQKVGTKSAAKALTLTNNGATSVTLSKVNVSGKDGKDFFQIDNCLSGAIAPGGSCSVKVTFAPTTTGVRNATLYIYVQGGVSPNPVQLTGYGT